jgi:hypothetical protein
MNPNSVEPENDPELRERLGFRLLKTGLLVAGSALLGGLAVVLWNRQSLIKLRQPAPVPNRSPMEGDAEED